MGKNLQDEGVVYVVEGLAYNGKCRALWLGSNGIGRKACAQLAVMLRVRISHSCRWALCFKGFPHRCGEVSGISSFKSCLQCFHLSGMSLCVELTTAIFACAPVPVNVTFCTGFCRCRIYFLCIAMCWDLR